MSFSADEEAQIAEAIAAGKLRRIEYGDLTPPKIRSRRGPQFDAEAYLARHRFLQERGLSIDSPRDQVIAAFNEGGLGTVTGRPVTQFNFDALRNGIRRALA